MDAPLQRFNTCGTPQTDPSVAPTNTKGEMNLDEFLRDFKEQVRGLWSNRTR
jgi:hypothetical protein